MSAAGSPRTPARAGRSQRPKGASASAGGGRPQRAANEPLPSGGRANRSPSGGSAAASAASVGAHHPSTITSVAHAPVSAAAGAILPGVRWALARDLRLALRSRAELAVQLLFYVIVVSLFPLATTPERTLLATMGPGVLWVAALLASLLSLPRLFAADYADGTLEQIALSPYPLESLVSGKVLAHWLTTGLPVVLLAPLLGVQYSMDGESLVVLSARAAARHADPVAARRDRRGADAGLACRQQPPRAPHPAAVRAGADLRRGRRRRRARGAWRRGQSLAAGRGTARRDRRCAVRGRRRRADRARLTSYARRMTSTGSARLAGDVLSARGQDDSVVRVGRRRSARRSGSTSASASRRPISSRARRTGSSSSTCRRRGCRCSSTS